MLLRFVFRSIQKGLAVEEHQANEYKQFASKSRKNFEALFQMTRFPNVLSHKPPYSDVLGRCMSINRHIK